MALLGTSEVASKLGISEAMVRQFASDRYYAAFLDIPRDERQYRSYTERDVAILKYVIRKADKGVPHKLIIEGFRTRGVDACLEESMGAEELNPMLQAQNERLLNENAALLREREETFRARQAQDAVISQLKDQVRDAETLVAKVRMAGYAFSRDADERIQSVQRNIRSMVREMDEAEEQYSLAVANLNAISSQLSSFVGRVFRGGALHAKLSEALVRLETADRQRRRAREDFENLLSLTEQFLLNQLQQALQLDSGLDRTGT